MSEFLKFAFELLSQVVYNIAECGAALLKLFVTGWVDYVTIFLTYIKDMSIPVMILSGLLMLVLFAIPVLAVILLVRHWIIRRRLKRDKTDHAELYREIGRLNKQVISLIDEKNRILALKVNTMGGVGRIPYVGASALADDTLPTVENVTGNVPAAAAAATVAAAAASEEIQEAAKEKAQNTAKRFPKLLLVDEKYADFVYPEYNKDISLEDFAEGYRMFAASRMQLYYTPEIIRRFIAGMASSRLLILEGISGTGKTSLPYSFSRYIDNPATIVSVQPSFRDRTELLGYFNEFSKRFNETEFLRALYEADYRPEPALIVLDEMNLARIEYYFAEMLSVLEMPSQDEWMLELVPTAWPKDPAKMEDGKIRVSPTTWFVGTANNDDSTFTITDKVYDRAMPIELNDRADEFVCELHPKCYITTEHLEFLFAKARAEHPISEEMVGKLQKLDHYLITRFKLAFGNRIMKQMYDFIPVYVACGGTEVDGMDYIIARKVLKKFESMNVSFVRDEITELINYIDKVFGKEHMQDSRAYLKRIQNLY